MTRTGVSVASLISVFHQLDVLSGAVFVQVTRQENVDSTRAARPTAAELGAYPIDARDYSCAQRHTAESSLRRAHAQLEKGWLTQKEFDVIEENCLDVIAKTADKG